VKAGRGIGVAVVVVTTALAGASGVLAEVGGKPANDIKRCDRYSRPCGPPVVVAEGFHAGAKREVVGMTSRLGTCLSFERVGDLFSIDYPCDEDASPAPREAIRLELVSTVTMIGPGPDERSHEFEVAGVLRRDVAAVAGRFRRADGSAVRPALTGEVPPDLAREIGFERPVGVFDFVIRQYPRHAGTLHLTARNAAGEIVGTENVRLPRGRSGVR
jgi:hypothetical protein